MIKYDDEAIGDFNALLGKHAYSRIFFLVDENTHEKCLPLLLRELPETGNMEILEVDPGEESKSPEVLTQLWMAMSDLGADRHSLLVNVGGGMITDLGGFLGGTYMRGIHFINFPTTVLAQVDASVGGKTGINLAHVKNRAGLFINAERVYILNDFLETLPVGERLSGFAEMLKHGLIADSSYWRDLCSFPITEKIPSGEAIRRSIAIKSAVVETDFKEAGRRKILNFGHTLGHAFESIALEEENPMLHGEAVALGMIGELLLSVEYAGLEADKANGAISKLISLYGNTAIPGKVERLLEVVRQDKKNKGAELRFTLLKDIGDAVVDIVVPEERVREILTYIQRREY